jgi:IS30 family transposase
MSAMPQCSSWKSGFNERLNGTLRREVLKAEWFQIIKQSQVEISAWLSE